MGGLLTFFGTTLGKALIEEVPDLVAKCISVWAKKGLVSHEEIAEFIATQWLDPKSLLRKTVQ